MADPASNRVVVTGTADAAALKARLEAKTKKAVEIISAGGGPEKAAPAGAGEKKADADGGADKGASPKEEEKEKEKEKEQPPEEKKPTEVGRYTTGKQCRPRNRQLSPPLPSNHSPLTCN
jgi:hypothetical protein